MILLLDAENPMVTTEVALHSLIKDTIDYKVRKDLSVFIPHIYESLVVEVTYNCGTNI